MKWTMTKIKKMTREELIATIDKANKTYTAYSTASKKELTNQLCNLINNGKI